MVLSEDFSSEMMIKLKESHLNPNAVFDELLLTNREGRSRLTYAINQKSLAKCQLYNERRYKWDQHVFLVPLHLLEAGANPKEWSEFVKGEKNRDQFIKDLRTP